MRHASLFLPLVLSGCAFFGLQPEGDSASSGGDGDGDMVGDGDFIGDGDGDLSTGGAPGDGDMSTGMRPGDGDGDTGGAWMGDGDGDTGGTTSGDGDTGGTMSGDGDTGGTGTGGAGSGGNGSGGSGISPIEELVRAYQSHLKINEVSAGFVEIYLAGEDPPDTLLDGFVVTVNGGDSCSLDGITMTSARRFAVAQANSVACPTTDMCVVMCPIDIELEDFVELSVELSGQWYVIDSQEQVDTTLTAIESFSARPDGSDDFDKVIFSRGLANN